MGGPAGLPPDPRVDSGGVSLYWTGNEVLAVVADLVKDGDVQTVASLDPATWTWGEPSTSPLSWLSGVPVWTGQQLVSLTADPDEDWGRSTRTSTRPSARGPGSRTLATSARTTPSGPVRSSWTCTPGRRWTRRQAELRQGAPPAGPATEVATQRLLSRSVEAWTGEELILWSGRPWRGTARPAHRRGLPASGHLGVATRRHGRPSHAGRQMQPALALGADGELRPRATLVALEEVRQVPLDGLAGDPELATDLVVR